MPSTTETEWRQGCIILAETIGLESDGAPIAIAISHDCDIAHKNLHAEPNVEFILGRITSTSDGSNEYAKNPRILHLPIKYKGENATVEILAFNKRSITKEVVSNHSPDSDYQIQPKELKILQDWLSARYKRQALPDSLNDRLKPVAEFMVKEGKKLASGIVGYWIDYDPRDNELKPDEAYEFWLYIVYSSDDPSFESDAITISEKIKSKFDQLIAKTSDKGNVLLKECKAYSEFDFTINDLRSNIHYRLEYLSNRIEPTGPTVD